MLCGWLWQAWPARRGPHGKPPQAADVSQFDTERHGPREDPGARSSAWSRYWATGALHSCPTSFAGNYDDSIGVFWRDALSDVGPQSRVLDIGTGNGAIPKLLLDALGEEKLPLIEAIDLSAVAPRWMQGCSAGVAAKIRFSGGVAAERLPFEEHSFTHAVSQYGFEYAARAPALAALLRVLRADARIALLMHHAQARPVAVAAEELAHVEWLLEDDGLLNAAQMLGPYLERAGSAAGQAGLRGDASAQQARRRYNALQRRAAERAADSAVPDLLTGFAPAIARLLAGVPASGWPQARERLSQMRQALADSRLRLQELRTHALGERQAQALAAALQAAGFRTTLDRLVTCGHLMGWTLVARRGAASAGRTGA